MSLRERLENHTGQYPPNWQFEEGAIVCGPILRYDEAHTVRGPALVVTIDDEERGPLAVWLSATVLLDQFKRLKPKVGEIVGVKCLGKSKTDQPYWRFHVEVDRGEPGEPDFDGIRPADAGQVEQDAEEDMGYDPFESD